MMKGPVISSSRAAALGANFPMNLVLAYSTSKVLHSVLFGGKADFVDEIDHGVHDGE